MGTTQGTTPTSTEVQTTTDIGAAALAALDTQLIGNVVSSLGKANDSAGRVVSDIGALAASIVELHQAETWKRTIDGDTGKLFTSAKAFYASLNRQDRFPHLHRILRTDLIATLMDGDQLVAIGTNELAALIGCDPATLSRNVKAIAATVEPEPISEGELEAVAEVAMAEAYKANPEATEAEIDYAIEAARSEAKAKAKAEAEAEATKAEAEAKAKAETKAVEKAAKVFITAVGGVHDTYHLMTPERQAEVLKEATALVESLTAYEDLKAKAEAEAEAPKPKRRGRNAS